MRAYANAMRHYATFSGRTSRSNYWWAHAVLLPLILVAFGVFGPPIPRPGEFGGRSYVPTLLFLLIVGPHAVPWAALTVRRLHDMNVRGWWALVTLVPIIPIVPLGIVALLAWACRRGTPGPNRFGPATAEAADPNVAVAPASPQPAPAVRRDPVAEIERLAGLKAAGALTEAEFATLKARAIGHGEVA